MNHSQALDIIRVQPTQTRVQLSKHSKPWVHQGKWGFNHKQNSWVLTEPTKKHFWFTSMCGRFNKQQTSCLQAAECGDDCNCRALGDWATQPHGWCDCGRNSWNLQRFGALWTSGSHGLIHLGTFHHDLTSRPKPGIMFFYRKIIPKWPNYSG